MRPFPALPQTAQRHSTYCHSPRAHAAVRNALPRWRCEHPHCPTRTAAAHPGLFESHNDGASFAPALHASVQREPGESEAAFLRKFELVGSLVGVALLQVGGASLPWLHALPTLQPLVTPAFSSSCTRFCRPPALHCLHNQERFSAVPTLPTPLQGCTLPGLALTRATWRALLAQPPQPEGDLSEADPALHRGLQLLRGLAPADLAGLGLHFEAHDALGRFAELCPGGAGLQVRVLKGPAGLSTIDSQWLVGVRF